MTPTDTQILALTLAQLEAMLTYRAPAFDAGTSTEVLRKPTSLRVTSASVYVDDAYGVRMAA